MYRAVLPSGKLFPTDRQHIQLKRLHDRLPIKTTGIQAFVLTQKSCT